MSTASFIQLINKKFPTVLAAPASEFYGRASTGVWFKGSEDGCLEDGLPAFNMNLYPDTLGAHPDIHKFCNENGFHVEPYDSGTFMAFK